MPRLDRWLSENDGKAWAERVFLAYTPVWIVAVAVVMLTGAVHRMGDAALLAFGLALMAPTVALPALLRGGPDRGRPFHEAYWFKFNVWIAIVAAVGSYFYTHFFFDVLGMRYGFPATWHLESELMRRPGNEVPLFLYPLAHTYFVTYYTLLTLGLRRLRRAWNLGRAGTALAAAVLCYAMAFGETLFMANDLLADFFWYADRGRMLAWGSVAYGLVFLVTLPFVFGVDERRDRRTPLATVVVGAAAAGMFALVVLEAWALVLGPLHS
jgi:cycloeucalenol cycloisomerase